MRNEKEMMDMITGTARKDGRIRGVYMSGSRTNPNAPRDIFQDYDIAYVVRETESFRKDRNWIDIFGGRMYMQYPDDRMGEGADPGNCYGYLMQLEDGNRLDLRLVTLEYAKKDILHDKLCRILLDKDKLLPGIPESSDEDHWVKKPEEEEYRFCCNEFWWILNSIGKGLWRGEIPYVMDMLNQHSRPELIRMLSWDVGVAAGFACSVGKSGKYFKRHLAKDKYDRLMRTYPKAEAEDIWQSVFEMCGFFEETAKRVGQALGYAYDEREAFNSRLYLDCTHELPRDAEEFLMVRRMREEDAEKTAKIWLEGNVGTHSFIPEKYWRDNYNSVKHQLAEAEVYVYEDSRGIKGFAGVEHGFIQGIFVKEEMRSKGIGKALLAVCKGKYTELSLHVYRENKKALEFYKREGFQISREQTESSTGQVEYVMIWRKG